MVVASVRLVVEIYWNCVWNKRYNRSGLEWLLAKNWQKSHLESEWRFVLCNIIIRTYSFPVHIWMLTGILLFSRGEVRWNLHMNTSQCGMNGVKTVRRLSFSNHTIKFTTSTRLCCWIFGTSEWIKSHVSHVNSTDEIVTNTTIRIQSNARTTYTTYIFLRSVASSAWWTLLGQSIVNKGYQRKMVRKWNFVPWKYNKGKMRMISGSLTSTAPNDDCHKAN